MSRFVDSRGVLAVRDLPASTRFYYCQEVSSRGTVVIAQPADRAYGLREFVIRTPDGHRLMFAERLG